MKNFFNYKWIEIGAIVILVAFSGIFLTVNLAGATVNYVHNGKITLCHWDNGQGGKYTPNDVSINSTSANGHDNHSNDIIPPYHYDFFTGHNHHVGDYPGKNFTGNGYATWNGGTCVPATPTLSPTPTPTVSPSATPTPTNAPTATPMPTEAPTAIPTPIENNECSDGQTWDSELNICIQCNGGGTCEVTITDESPTPTPTETPTVTPVPTSSDSGSSSSNTSSNNNVSLVDAASAVSDGKKGKVNTASLAGTGTFESDLAVGEQLLGFLLSSAGVFVYGKKKTSTNK